MRPVQIYVKTSYWLFIVCVNLLLTTNIYQGFSYDFSNCYKFISAITKLPYTRIKIRETTEKFLVQPRSSFKRILCLIRFWEIVRAFSAYLRRYFLSIYIYVLSFSVYSFFPIYLKNFFSSYIFINTYTCTESFFQCKSLTIHFLKLSCISVYVFLVSCSLKILYQILS